MSFGGFQSQKMNGDFKSKEHKTAKYAHCPCMLVPASHHYFSRVNFIVGGSLAASMNTNIGYDQRSYFQWVQLSLATKDGRQLNTACLLTETFKGTTAAVQQWLWTPSTQVRKLVSDQNSHVRPSRYVKVGMVKNSLT